MLVLVKMLLFYCCRRYRDLVEFVASNAEAFAAGAVNRCVERHVKQS